MPSPAPLAPAAAARLQAAWPAQAGPSPRVAVILGSGWDGVAGAIEHPIDLPYAELPGFPAPGVAGHAGSVRMGRLAGAPVLLLRGRRHVYEDGNAAAMRGAIEALAAFGCSHLVLTNAAGSLKPAMGPGALMLIADHLNIAQVTPLEHDAGNARFVDMVGCWSAEERALVRRVAAVEAPGLHEGIYAYVRGPQFETPAEIRMLQALGADAVGMSTVPEAILARRFGLTLLGLSMVTNLGAGLGQESLSHAHTLAQAQAAAGQAVRLLQAILPPLHALASRPRP